MVKQSKNNRLHFIGSVLCICLKLTYHTVLLKYSDIAAFLGGLFCLKKKNKPTTLCVLITAKQHLKQWMHCFSCRIPNLCWYGGPNADSRISVLKVINLSHRQSVPSFPVVTHCIFQFDSLIWHSAVLFPRCTCSDSATFKVLVQLWASCFTVTCSPLKQMWLT